MPLATPGRLQQQAEVYRQLGNLIQAGVPILQGIRLLRQSPPAAWASRLAGQCLAALEEGTTLTEAFHRVHPPLPEFDLALIEAGEQGGRLVEVLRLLASHYELQAQIARQTLSDLLYPVFLLHFAVFIFPLPNLVVTGNVAGFLLQTGGLLVPLYLLLGLLWYAFRPTHSETWRARMERWMEWVPVLGKARRKLVLARLTAALQALINAGVPIFRAWELAAAASGSPAIRRAVGQWPPLLAAGQTPAELVKASGCFPTMFANLYASGEVSGRLDEELRHLQFLYSEEGQHEMRLFWSWVPKITYLIIALAIAYKIITSYLGYFSGVFKEM
ncbi:type II secretion system F family protein [Fontisphaera persica]|uniref:type II secretion system F family protein n=1 Tax=Fontisphaera persica TaxID=2974023 RepID=UPI0024BF2422|nr:type II secretion system F family protein [Fontisphaera persica]WCJ59841.1 type II secretion system F family protein [Fontisphaera persica]